MLQCEELKDDDRPSNTLEQFTELEQVLGMIENINSIQSQGFEKEYELYTQILTRFVANIYLVTQ